MLDRNNVDIAVGDIVAYATMIGDRTQLRVGRVSNVKESSVRIMPDRAKFGYRSEKIQAVSVRFSEKILVVQPEAFQPVEAK